MTSIALEMWYADSARSYAFAPAWCFATDLDPVDARILHGKVHRALPP